MTLWGLWYLSLALAGASVAIMLLLVLRRLVEMRLARRREARRAAASAMLMRYLDGKAAPAAVYAAAGGRVDIVGELIFEMRGLMRGEGTAPLIALAAAGGGLAREQRRLRRRNPAARAEAVRRLVIYGGDAVPLLEAALRDPNPGVRTAAAVELTAIDAAPPLAALAELMHVADGVYSEDLRRIFRSAVAAETRTAIAMLDDEWTGDSLRVLLLDGLGRAGAFEALRAMTAMTQHATAEVRIEALRGLGSLAHPSATSAAIEATMDPDWRVRVQAANCLRRIGADDASDALEALLDDEQWWVRFRAAEALSALAPGRARLSNAATRGDRAGQVAQLVLAEKGLA
jgi:hypothetical protein